MTKALQDHLSQSRTLAISKQGLASQQMFGTGLAGTLSAIEELGYVQIDSLSVIERAHHHILWNRVPDYDPNHLNQLISDQQIFEYWYHAASYLPMRDYRFALPNMLSIRNGENRYYTNADINLMGEILARIKAEGPLRLRDFEKTSKAKSKSWSWGPTKRALDKLFMQGDLMVSRRNGMEKFYDLADRCLPDGIDLSVPTVSEYANYLLDTTIRAHGIFTWKQLLHLKTGKTLRDAMAEVVKQRIEAGELKRLDDIDMPTAYVDIKALEQTPTVKAKAIKVLSPFDNLVIHRDRLSRLFGFNYRLECYVPAAKRVFGYFCLPILYGDKIVGRIDCKAHRADQRFEVISLNWEDDNLNPEQFLPELRTELRTELQRFANFNNCPLLDMKAI